MDWLDEYKRCKTNAENALKSLSGLAGRPEARQVKATEAAAWATPALAEATAAATTSAQRGMAAPDHPY